MNQRAKWERGLVYGFVVLGVAVPMATHFGSSALHPPEQLWFNRVMCFAVPCLVAVFPFLVNLLRRERIFTLGSIVATCAFACVLSFGTFFFRVTTRI